MKFLDKVFWDIWIMFYYFKLEWEYKIKKFLQRDKFISINKPIKEK